MLAAGLVQVPASVLASCAENTDPSNESGMPSGDNITVPLPSDIALNILAFFECYKPAVLVLYILVQKYPKVPVNTALVDIIQKLPKLA